MRVRADLVIIVPSRGRPDAAADLARAVERTSTALTALIVAVDLTDPSADAYPIAATTTPPMPGLLTVDNTRSATEALNRAALRYAPGARALAYLPDSQRPVATGWDQHLVDALDRHGFARGHEVSARTAQRCRHIAVRADVVTTLGYMVPPTLHSSVWPDVWTRWAMVCGGMAVCDDVVIERAPGLAERNSAGRFTHGWSDYAKDRLHADIDQLQRLASRTWMTVV